MSLFQGIGLTVPSQKKGLDKHTGSTDGLFGINYLAAVKHQYL